MKSMWLENRPLFALAAAHVALFALLLPAVLLDPRLVTGQPVWVKPMKFAASISVYSLTLLWLMRYAQPGVVRPVSWIATAMLLIEIVCIVLQAARGVPSHFNIDSAFDGAIFSIMGIGITVLWIAQIVLLISIIRRPRAGVSAVEIAAARGALFASAIGMAAAFLMTAPGFDGPLVFSASGQPYPTGHAVGAPEDAGMSVLGWSLTGGDLRVSHFAGLHAMQLIPLFGIFVSSRVVDALRAVRLVHGFSFAYSLWIVLLAVQALRGIPFFKIDPVTGAGYLALMLCIVLALLPAQKMEESR